MRGRKPKPAVLHELHGNPSHSRTPRPIAAAWQSSAAAVVLEPPDGFTDDQRALWQHALTHAPPRVLTRIDRGVLAVWVIAADLHRQAVLAQNKRQLLIRAPNSGLPMQSPYLPIINRQALIMIKAATELGFSPTARERVGAPDGAASSGAGSAEFDQWLADNDPQAELNIGAHARHRHHGTHLAHGCAAD
jgi:phage terminase small subunit